jgi:putative hydroxymethylpyrimidine transport system substrate-binding protein
VTPSSLAATGDLRSVRRRRKAAILLPLLCAALSLAACSEKSDVTAAAGTKPFSVMLDWFPNADHAPMYAAIHEGDFRAVGLEVHLDTPADPSEGLKLLAAGRVDAAISYEPEVLIARDQGLRVVSIGALIQRPLDAFIAPRSAHVRSIADLAGKTVGTAGIPYQRAELRTALEHAGVSPSSVREVNLGVNLVPAMLSGKVPATLGGFWNYEAIQLQQLGKQPVTIPVDQAGVPEYDELVLVVRADEARSRGQDLRAFLQALTRGERAVRADPAGAVALVMGANPSLDRKLELASLQRTLPATVPSVAGKPFGWQDPSAWGSFARWMYSHKLLAHNPDQEGLAYTDEYVPGEGI